MAETIHQWRLFGKGRMRVEACLKCGELRLASNTSEPCADSQLSESLIVKAGYKIISEDENSIHSAA